MASSPPLLPPPPDLPASSPSLRWVLPLQTRMERLKSTHPQTHRPNISTPGATHPSTPPPRVPGTEQIPHRDTPRDRSVVSMSCHHASGSQQGHLSPPVSPCASGRGIRFASQPKIGLQPGGDAPLKELIPSCRVGEEACRTSSEGPLPHAACCPDLPVASGEAVMWGGTGRGHHSGTRMLRAAPPRVVCWERVVPAVRPRRRTARK